MQHMRISLAVLFALGSATAVVAQQSQAPANGRHALKGRSAFGPGGPRLGGALLRGITLSDNEKANLKRARENSQKQVKALREQYKPQHEALRAARQRHDTAAVKALWAQGAPERQAMQQLMQTQRADMRAALTTENQAKFDANVAKVEQRVAQRGGGKQRPSARHPGGR